MTDVTGVTGVTGVTAETEQTESSDPPDDVALWQETLAVEHSVIWAFGVLGAVPGFDEAAAAALRVHRDRRTTCNDVIIELDGDPVASAPAYDVPRPADAAAARRLGAELDAAASIAYAGLAGAASRNTRLLASRWLRESAIAESAWDGVVPALPGLEPD